MQILMVILGVIAAIIVFGLVIALFLKKEYSIERQIRISKPSNEVFEYVRHLKNQDYYSKWVMQDPAAQKTFRGTDGHVGFVYAWNGNSKAGEGEQEIIKIEEGREVLTEIRFVRPFKSTGYTPMRVEPISKNETLVIWGMNGTNKYPLNLMTALMKGALGKDLELSLTNLKNNLEKQNNKAQVAHQPA